MPNIYYKPFTFQEQFHDAVKPNVYLSAGFGAGKTYSLIMKMFKLCNENYGLPGGFLVPTLKMFKRDVLPTVREICHDNNILYKFHKQDFYFYFPDTQTIIYVFHSEDDGDSIRGPNLAFGLINEVTLCSKGAFHAFQSRVRLKKAKLKQIAMSGTPESFNWAYDYFVEEPRQDTDFIFGDMRLNTEIADDYAARLMESYDPRMVEQYVEGKFVSLSGNQALYAFNRQRHASDDIERIEDAPIWISLDFNVDPMAATLWNPMPRTHKIWLRGFDQIKITGSADTYLMCQAIKEKVGKENLDLVTIYPDPAGKARSTKVKKSMPQSDLAILEHEGFNVLKYKTRLSVRDCLNASNNLFAKDRVRVDRKRCKDFVSDAEQCKLMDGVLQIDKQNQKRSHWLDGFKNMADYEYPVARRPQHRSVNR